MLNDRITKSFCSRPLTNVLTLKSNARPDGPHFGSNSTLYRAKLPPNAQGMPVGGGGGGVMDCFGIDGYIINTVIDCFQSSKNEEKWNVCVMSANTESYFVVFVLEMLQIYRTTFWDPKKWNLLHL